MKYNKKLNIAGDMYISLFIGPGNKEKDSLKKKIFFAYLFQCLFLGKEQFTIVFNGKYTRPFWSRFYEWVKCTGDCLYLFFLKYFTTEAFRYRITNFPSNKFDIHAYNLIYNGVRKPLDTKVTNVPNKFLMKYYLEKHSLEIKNEYLNLVEAKYEIGPINLPEKVNTLQ